MQYRNNSSAGYTSIKDEYSHEYATYANQFTFNLLHEYGHINLAL